MSTAHNNTLATLHLLHDCNIIVILEPHIFIHADSPAGCAQFPSFNIRTNIDANTKVVAYLNKRFGARTHARHGPHFSSVRLGNTTVTGFY